MTKDDLEHAKEVFRFSSEEMYKLGPKLIAEVERLQTMIKSVQWQNNGTNYCPWCHARPQNEGKHEDWCLAFTPDGQVK